MPAVSVHHTDTTDEPWDGPAAVAAMPAEKAVLTYCHAWYSADGDRDEKSSYKFPHAREEGGPANLPACRNGLARLDSADIPDGDRDGVRKHLQAHLDDAKDDDTEDRMSRRVPTGLRSVAWPKAVMRAHQEKSPKAGAPLAMDGRRPFEIRNSADGGEAEVWLYDEIGGWGVWAEDVVRDLSRVTANAITVRLNSPGGDYFDGVAIMNALLAHPAYVTVKVDGLAASIASVICLAGDKVVMGPGSKQMVHNASTMAWGNAAEMRCTADLLDQVSAGIAQAYADRSGGDVADWQTRMDAETWLDADECVRLGLADQVAALPSRAGAAAGVDPDPENRATRPPVAALRPAARAEGLAPDAGDVTMPVDASAGGVDASAGDVTVPEDAPAEDAPAVGGYDVALVAQVMGWALAVDQHVDRLIAECAAALGIDNPDVDNDGPPPPLPPGDAGLGYALGILTAVDTVVDGAQVILAKALGIENPDPDEDDEGDEPVEPARRGPGMTGVPVEASTTDTPGTGATATVTDEQVSDAWADITNHLTTTTSTPDDVYATQEGAWWQ